MRVLQSKCPVDLHKNPVYLGQFKDWEITGKIFLQEGDSLYCGEFLSIEDESEHFVRGDEFRLFDCYFFINYNYHPELICSAPTVTMN